MAGLIEKLERRSRGIFIFLSLSVLALTGMVDYLTGFEVQFSVFYLLGVGLAVCWARRAQLARMASPHFVKELTVSHSPGRRQFKQALLVLAAILFALPAVYLLFAAWKQIRKSDE